MVIRQRQSPVQQMARRRTLENLAVRRGLLPDERREKDRLDHNFYMREYRRL